MNQQEEQKKPHNPVVQRLLTPEEVSIVGGGETIGERQYCSHKNYGGNYEQKCSGIW
jgi:hypothetical protein